jgi:hypothetical protein
VYRDGPVGSQGTVSIATVPGSGTATAGLPNTVCQPGQDYTSDGRTLIFPAGDTNSQVFTVRICRDLVFELTETFDVQLSNPTGGFFAAPGDARATAEIIDDDNAPYLRIGSLTCQPENNGTVTLTVTQTTATNTNTTFTYNGCGWRHGRRGHRLQPGGERYGNDRCGPDQHHYHHSDRRRQHR